MDINGILNIVKEHMNALVIVFGMLLINNVFVGTLIIGLGLHAFRFQPVEEDNTGIWFYRSVFVVQLSNGMVQTVFYAEMDKFGILQL